MNKIDKLLEDLDKQCKTDSHFSRGLPLSNLEIKESLKVIIKDFCTDLVTDARYITFDDSVSEFLKIYLNPEPKSTKVKVTISTLKQFNWKDVYELVGIDYNGFDEFHMVEMEEEIFKKLFKVN